MSMDSERTGCRLYLQMKFTEESCDDSGDAIANAADNERKEKNGTGQAADVSVGKDGTLSFKEKEKKLNKEYNIVVLPEFTTVAYPDANLPMMVTTLADMIINDPGEHAQAALNEWVQEIRESKYAKDLVQVYYDENGNEVATGGGDNNNVTNKKVISPDPTTWKCEESGETDNLWLNLSTGFIGSGRRHYDGSGGNGSALRHFEATGSRYPLVVKLGTITPHGADVYSYAKDEDDLVKDPLLSEHLAHWGIDIMIMKKTEKNMAELQLELNQKFEFDRITEAGANLEAVSGAGLVGLKNLGNSCYINSTLQVLYSLPETNQRYTESALTMFKDAPSVPQEDLLTQLSRLGLGIMKPDIDAKSKALCHPSVAPRTFRSLVGKGHPEFSTAHQQDALEYFDFLMELITRIEHAGRTNSRINVESTPLPSLFRYDVESRYHIADSGKIMYKTSPETALRLNIPIDAATNGDEVSAYEEREAKRQKMKEANAVAYIGDGSNGRSESAPVDIKVGDAVTIGKEEPVIPRVPFDSCLKQFVEQEVIHEYLSPTTGQMTTAMKQVRMKTFPPYLVMQMKRYYVDNNWSSKKLNVLVDVPQTIDMTSMRGRGPVDGEDILEEADAIDTNNTSANQPEVVVPNADIVAQLVGMGFSENASKRAVLATGNNSAEASMEWVFAHMEDSDFNDPLPEPKPTRESEEPSVNPENVQMLSAMGFSEVHAKGALKACNGSLERAADWLFSHADNLDAACAEVEQAQVPNAGAGDTSAGEQGTMLDGEGKYTLFAIVSHIGSNTGSGHYVSHIRKGDKWILFNDEKVATSSSPPIDLGYLYFFKRNDWDGSQFMS